MKPFVSFGGYTVTAAAADSPLLHHKLKKQA
jgi:hypothetical protein